MNRRCDKLLGSGHFRRTPLIHTGGWAGD